MFLCDELDDVNSWWLGHTWKQGLLKFSHFKFWNIFNSPASVKKEKEVDCETKKATVLWMKFHN